MNVGGTYDLAGNTISSTSFINDGTAHIYRVDLFTTMSGTAANESFGAQSFNLTLTVLSLSRNTLNISGSDCSLASQITSAIIRQLRISPRQE